MAAPTREEETKKTDWADASDDDDTTPATSATTTTTQPADQFLLEQDPTAVPYFSLTGFSTKGRLVEVSSGDTCVVMFIFGGLPTKVKARLRGVTAPKIGSYHPKEHEDGLTARQFLWAASREGRALLDVHFDRCDLRGQALITVRDEQGRDINEEMIRKRLVYPYQQYRPNTRPLPRSSTPSLALGRHDVASPPPPRHAPTSSSPSYTSAPPPRSNAYPPLPRRERRD